MMKRKKQDTVWKYRRYKALVDVLASDKPGDGIMSLAEAWGVKIDYASGKSNYALTVEAICNLARLAQRHCRAELQAMETQEGEVE